MIKHKPGNCGRVMHLWDRLEKLVWTQLGVKEVAIMLSVKKEAVGFV
jgi:hypothetical protein